MSSEIDRDAFFDPVAIADGAQFLIHARLLVDGVGPGHGGAFGQVCGRLHMRWPLAVERAHGDAFRLRGARGNPIFISRRLNEPRRR